MSDTRSECRLEEVGKQADRRIDRAEARGTDLQHDLHQAQHRAHQVLCCPTCALTQNVSQLLASCEAGGRGQSVRVCSGCAQVVPLVGKPPDISL